MLVAVISDVHGNLAALEAALAAVATEGVDEIWFLGDTVGYGARPEQCAALLAEAASVALVGNHDLAVLGRTSLEHFQGRIVPTFAWTHAQLSEQSLAWLSSLEPRGRPQGRADVGLYHGSPRDPVWEYVLSVPLMKEIWATQDERLILVGHSHIPFAYQDALVDGRLRDAARPGEWVELGERRWIMNPGSVGQPRDGDWRASLLLLDLERGCFQLRRVEYDVERTVEEILRSPLPDSFAERLREGR